MPVSPQSVLAAILVASGFGALVMCLLVLRYGFAAPPDDAPQARRREVATRLGHAIAGTCFAATAILAVVLMAHARREPGAPSPVPGDEPDGLEQVVGARVSGVSERLAALELRVDAMEAGVRPLDDRVSDTRAQLDLVAAELEHATPRVSAVESLVRQHTDELGRATARLRQLEAQKAVVPQRPPPTPSGVSGPRAAEPAPPARWIPARETPAPSPPSRSPLPLPRGMAPTQPPTRGVAPAPDPPRALTPAPAATGPVASAGGAAGAAEGDKRDEGLSGRIRDDWQTVRRGFADAGQDFRSALDSLRRNLRDTLGR